MLRQVVRLDSRKGAALEKNVQMTLLLDLYGTLLTQKQREALSLHLEEDLSYAEIAAELGISRQGAADAAGAAKEQLSYYEEKLGLLRRHMRTQALVEKALGHIEGMKDAQVLRDILSELIEGEEHGV